MATMNVTVQEKVAWPLDEVSQYDLKAGPSKMALVMALAYRGGDPENDNGPLAVTFTTEHGRRLRVWINVLANEDSSGCNFIFRGLVSEMDDTTLAWRDRRCDCFGFFDTRDRKGYIRIHNRNGR